MPPRNQSAASHVIVRGAREHNLKGVDLEFPRDALTTFTGVSGSGKSSLAYHTIYQEGQRRFLESLSSYARQFLGRMEKPRVDHVEGLSPTVSIDQKSGGTGTRSTVGTLTEILDYLRLLYARLGTPVCPECGAKIEAWSPDRIVQAVLADCAGQKVQVLAPVVRERKGQYRQELIQWRQKGFVRARIDGVVRRLDEDITLHRYKYHTIELVVDRLAVAGDKVSRLAEAVEQALALGKGTATLAIEGAGDRVFSTRRACPEGHGALPEMEPRLFSFNSPIGACPHCDGLGECHSFSEELLVADPEATVRGGALHGFTPEGKLVYSRLTFDHLEEVAAAFGFDLETPWQDLTRRQRKVLLHGSGRVKFEFRWRKDGAHLRTSGRDTGAFPGLVQHLEAVYRPSRARHLDRYRAAVPCPECAGERLGPASRAVTLAGRSLPSLCGATIDEALAWMGAIELTGNRLAVGGEVVAEIERRLTFLTEVGLGYLTLDRRARTLSGGESQRIRLAAQVGAGLRGVLYVLDEPSIGLHARDQKRLLGTLRALRDRGNTVCVVEHDEATMLASDHLVDVGPGAGVHGGEIVVHGSPAEVRDHPDSLTGAYLRGDRRIPLPTRRRTGTGAVLQVLGAVHHNLKNIDVTVRLGTFTAVTGVSGSGKSTLVHHILQRVLRRELHGAQEVPGRHQKVVGIEHVDKLVEIDQKPIGRTPRSNPATYTGVWTPIRDLYAALPEARLREYKKGRFSFNVAGGRCEACDGAGIKLLEMNFLAPVQVTCDVCQGRRFNPETLEVKFKGCDVHDLLELSIEEAMDLFGALPKIARGLQALVDVGLGYVKLGQPSTTLSGGEAQRVKLATELQRPATGRTLYVLDEPTTGLHFADIERLLGCLQRLVDGGNTVLVIEHNLDVIKCADQVIDLGPEGGEGGGRVVAVGTPEEVARQPTSHTGVALAPVLEPRKRKLTAIGKGRRRPAPKHITVQGARVHNLKNIDLKIPLDRFTVVTGPSGSGKSSLAFDTLFTEGQRRFIESMSTYARRFLGRMDRAPVERLEGLGPAIAIDQRAASRSPRSTVATATEIHDYLRLLFARIGRPHCPTHGQELVLHSPSRIAKELLAEFRGERGYVLAPVRLPDHARDHRELLAEYLEGRRAAWREAGFVRALVDGTEHRLDAPLPLPGGDTLPEVHLVVDRVTFKDRGRLVDSTAQAAEQGKGIVVVRTESGAERIYSTDRSCPLCGHGVPVDPHPRWFSFNHHSGACPDCAGLGQQVACDPALLVNYPGKPLFAGAVHQKGAAFTFLTKKNGWYHKGAMALAKRFGIDLEVPFADLADEAQKLLLWGAGDERFEVTWRRNRKSSARTWKMSVQWKGLARQVEEWFVGQDPQQTGERYAGVMRTRPCRTCNGDRLATAQRHVFVGRESLPALTRKTVGEALAFLAGLRLRKTERIIAAETLAEIRARLGFLDSVGLDYLTLGRTSATLSGGEAQRIRLATQLGNRLVGVLYVLDEPTIGLHPRDTDRLLATLLELRDLGNTVVAVEHDELVIRRADHVIDMGPGAGHRGGEVVAEGKPSAIARSGSLTGRYLRGALAIGVPGQRRQGNGTLRVEGLAAHNVRGVDLEIPRGAFTAVTGVSGSGKSSLILDALVPALRARDDRDLAVVVVDQDPIGTTPASNPATYCGILTPIRSLFAMVPQARSKGFGPGRFSFNVAQGRCGDCEGKGQIRVEMHFLADVWITCETCRGRRYDAETLTIEWRGRNIAEVLAMEVEEALAFFGNHRAIARPLQLLLDVGLGYLQLGQAATTLSGGEAQRLKLVQQLQKKPKAHTVYVLDEPTTGLHMDDVAKLMLVLDRLVERGDTVVVIEHHLDVITQADLVLEMGPEAGDSGGRIVARGTPEEIARAGVGHTAPFLRAHLRARRAGSSKRRRTTAREAAL